MRILLLGGTGYVGRVIATEAIARGHEVTTFNRGLRPAPEGAVAVIGDRLATDRDGYAGLDKFGFFDAVIDTWNGDAAAVAGAVAALRGRFRHYTFVSTVSVHDPLEPEAGTGKRDDALFDEDTRLYDVEIPGAEASVYRFNKRRSEIEASKAAENDGSTPVPILIARPGVILGPHERLANGARLPWWLRRLHKGGPTLAPCPRDLVLQFIDVRDLAAFVISAAEKRLDGAYILNGEAGGPATTMEEFLAYANKVAGGGQAELCWMDAKPILDAGVEPWVQLPLWTPETALGDTKKRADIYNWDVAKAQREGLRTRPFQETVRDTWEWMVSEDLIDDPAVTPAIGLDPEKEARLLGLAFRGDSTS